MIFGLDNRTGATKGLERQIMGKPFSKNLAGQGSWKMACLDLQRFSYVTAAVRHSPTAAVVIPDKLGKSCI
jgi:hypothetical protein